jgi:acyl-CoA synthetase (AMP-forming)/AMP-acid ligase II
VLPDVITKAAAQYGDRSAYVSADQWSLTYAQLDRFSDEAAMGLSDRGIAERSVVALALNSVIDYVVAYAALAKLGAISAGVNPRLTAVEQRAVIESIGADAVLATDSSAPVVPDDVSTIEVTLADNADAVLRDLRVSHSVPSRLDDDSTRPVCICFTSGSTGAPKGAFYTNGQLSTIAELDSGGAWGGGGNMIASTQFAHVGFMTKIPWMLASGGTTRLLTRWRASDVMALIARYRMPAVNAVPPQLALMLRQDDFESYDFDCVKAIVAGGGASSPALIAEARSRFGAPYSVRYSSTESGGVGLATALDAEEHEALHTIGRPRNGVEAAVFDDDGKALASGETGELWLRSDAVMAGYWGQPQLTSETLVDGWLHTGDLAQRDDEGLYTLCGRRSEMFIRGGYNVYPLEVEAVLAGHPAVEEVAVISRSDDVMGEIGVAIVVPRSIGRPPELEDLRAFAGDQLAHHKLPEAIRLVDELPLNSLSKVDRLRLSAEDAAQV